MTAIIAVVVELARHFTIHGVLFTVSWHTREANATFRQELLKRVANKAGLQAENLGTYQIHTPKIGYYAEKASDELINLLWDSFLNYSKRDMIDIKNLHSKSRNAWKKVPTIVQDPYSYLSRNVATGLYIKCVSVNLHLTSESEEEYEDISAEDGQLKKIAAFKIRQDPKDAFFAWKKEQVFVVVHSPFVPVDPVSDGTAVQPGYDYNFHINLEEEHLQPHPYKTNCTNYEAEWTKNNRTGPRSQEMCKELCRLTYSRRCFGCERIRLTNTNPRNACLEDTYVMKNCLKDGEYKKMHHCNSHCKRACKKLKYRYSVTRIKNNSKYSSDSENVTINLYVHTDVTVLSHNPLYGVS
ncbi:hypothetical protein AVEN_162179-1 [Araneus ventricosus]|uniref:Uncharacterized protein n=1 Tax=Araneus ventricosus TaxID=182803 RepID=A0A4Y2GYM3_ARAVE|nr:hypothetical protein AVEN_162179-1 [Araneus ventricosus]